MSEPLIHILKHGQAMCGKPGVPGDWKDGHRWIGFNRPDQFEEQSPFTCQPCLFAYKKSVE